MGSLTRPLVAILLPDLRGGGAEKLHVNLAREFVSRGIDVDFVLRQERGELLSELPEGAMVHALRAEKVRHSLRPLIRYLRRRRPSSMLAAMWPLTVVAPVAARIAGHGGRVVVSEHSPQSLAYAHRGVVHHSIMRTSMAVGYALADARLGVSSGVADDMARLSWMSRSRFDVVFNPAATGSAHIAGLVRPPELQEAPGPVILSVGNLKKVKRQDSLIRAFGAAGVPGARLCILGEGPERPELEALVAALGLEGKVLLPGFRTDVAAWYAHADLFVLSSEREGFGNVLVEAMEFGLPIVCTDCPTGPREILDDGRYGRLVPVGDVSALAEAMKQALGTPVPANVIRERARDFSVATIADRYLAFLLPDEVRALSLSTRREPGA